MYSIRMLSPLKMIYLVGKARKKRGREEKGTQTFLGSNPIQPILPVIQTCEVMSLSNDFRI